MAEPQPSRAPAGGIGAAVAAANERARRSLLRNHGGGHAAVTNLELFFDLVFVFAVTQLSHFLLGELTPTGAVKTLILFGAVWWGWMWTTWATNWINPDRGVVRMLIGALMLASLILSAAIPYAFGHGGLLFVVPYCAMQIGRCLFVAWAMDREENGNGRNMLRASIWFAVAAVLWIVGACTTDVSARILWWLAALAIEYTAPMVFLWVPGMGRSSLAEWQVSGSHMAERCSLFIIIALGEGLVITGATYSAAKAQPGLDLALLNAMLGSFAMWWLYFDMGARRGARHIENHELPGLVARQAFTYWHIPIVAGIIVLAVADELVLAHPLEPAHLDLMLVTVSGAVLFLGGLAGFKRISSGNPWFPASHVYGLCLLLPLILWGWLAHPPGLLFYAAITLLFAVVAIWEWGSFHGGWMERMESRGWWIARLMRRRLEQRRERRLARAAHENR
ncbi:low temperature requirement protein A [Novosphingobium aquiterrae]|uniref:Low temperature requirement protein A n=1 Tax=Novosphingobium aquiterrae TaxID=624388 RepID=A0ABV6PE73_9SPHN